MNYNQIFNIHYVHSLNKYNIKVILNSEARSVHTLGDLQEYIHNSKNYFAFTYKNGHKMIATSGKNLEGCNHSRLYSSCPHPPVWGLFLVNDMFDDLVSVQEFESPDKQKELFAKSMSPIDIMLANLNTVYVVDDGTGKIEFQIGFDIDHNLTMCFNYGISKSCISWRAVSNIPRYANPGSIAEIIKLGVVPDAQWLIDFVKSGGKFYKKSSVEDVDLNKLKQLFPDGFTIYRDNDQIVIKKS